MSVGSAFKNRAQKKGAAPYNNFDNCPEMNKKERKRLNASIKRGVEQARQGQGQPAEEVIAELRQRGMVLREWEK